MKKLFFILLSITLLMSCESDTKKIESNKNDVQNDSIKKEQINYKVAVEFLNNYLNYINDTVGKVSELDYIKQNELLTENFKNRYQSIIDSAEEKNPEVGLGFNPILDAQDSPDVFEFKSIDEKNNYVTLKGDKNWSDFEVTVKVSTENGKSLVDGLGIINIPSNKQAKR